ncbi:hypothetical protein N181_19030 [Sinorhizobium fredii USDA 205]|uniref:Transmembrane protein n=1 Tax=Rhizobium fredii TaxID=380 RepID=A0A844AE15_RHIFR|nr:hypothetical protein [Sinorhizobium fredii]AWM26716.1 hypothetical protein AOX55_00003485 [Sinorhizobium fredii CCBAU 25509]KSV87192.1 hypothetical protein N181_19030 [Sinorhizobium fredii USDA 205]MQX10561.1 hypothetical protein [Sinorhizobium fredii]GEC34488.1 hypothetical protein EFR01_46590 [Sinorhizobium fredii]GLS12444.1 hypothetical protein GCM10007864_60770 [Sinorhizobium fredii]
MSKVPAMASNPAQLRGDIQRGRTGDKKPGFDPAAAPLETDGEAAGTPLDPEATREARVAQLHGKPVEVATEFGDAMRPFAAAESGQSSRPRLGLSLLISGVVLAATALVYAVAAGWI